MKKKLINSWDKINPDSAADERMKNAIFAKNDEAEPARENKASLRKARLRKRLVPLAACFALLVALSVFLADNAGLFLPRAYSEDLGKSGKLSFYKSGGEADAADINLPDDVAARLLTDEEKISFFGSLENAPEHGYGYFNINTGEFYRLEDKIGETTVILATHGAPLSCTSVEGETKTSAINGTPVSAGYFVTRANSRGERNIIYYATFELNGLTVYLETGGSSLEKEKLLSAISGIIAEMTEGNSEEAISRTIDE